MELNLHRTPLYDRHMENGAVMAPFMGCLMPAHFGSAREEHLAVRKAAGLFDAAHRCEVEISGPDAVKNLQNLLCSNIRPLMPGEVRRSLMLNMQGGVMDDVQLYRLSEDTYRLAIHTVNRDKDLRHIRRQKIGDVSVTEPEAECRLSLDGPKAAEILSALTNEIPEAGHFLFAPVGGISSRISRIGFAGEDGFSISCSLADGEKMLVNLLDAGKTFGLRQCGALSFDSLRLEAGHSRYGMDIDDAVNPLETGFRKLVHMEKRDFIGRDALVAGGEPRRARVGLKLKENVALTGSSVVHRDKEVGTVTSGGYCPYLDASLALALVETPYSEIGRKYRVEIGDELVEAHVVALPFYTRST
ncbi:MAG: glycine cleavage system aminomethyltransferase GcvT [Clostridia bacterium]|nr:glycine cleavage system aminomethyltransferase GcvT [Clostridia bacterium]